MGLLGHPSALRLPRLSRYRRFAFISCLFALLFATYRQFYAPRTRLSVKYVPPVFPKYDCPVGESPPESGTIRSSMAVETETAKNCETRVLLLIDNQYSALGQQIRMTLNYLKVAYKTQVVRRNLPSLANRSTGRYLIIIYENYYRYLNLNKWNRQLLDRYCRMYGASIIGFLPSRVDASRPVGRSKVLGFPLYLHSGVRLHEANVTNASQLAYFVRRGASFTSQLASSPTGWVGLMPDHITYEPILYGMASVADEPGEANVSLVLLDAGKLDGVRRLLFGNDFANFWPMKLLFLDGLRYLSYRRIALPLTRYVQIDIDDVFVGQEGSKMNADDVQELARSQQRLRAYVNNFFYNLGFCGRFFGRGNVHDTEGDRMLIARADEFRWFPHFWSHSRAHVRSRLREVVEEMHLNKNFAEEHGLKVLHAYAVAPHHAGVYPTHDALFDAWKDVWNVQVTSTEEYPHLKPASLRRGFVYRDIMVLPRQTCGLYTHTIYMDQFPGGKRKLDDDIYGGELFYTFVFNPFLIFMTHQANYARDRLAIYTFENVVKFIRCWTNLKLETISPTALAEKYFQAYPQEVNPIWGNPCRDKRHLAILASEKVCERFPQAVIVGPQKTGTTALYKFLQLHPMVRVSLQHPTTYEEVQFFCGKNYMTGINAYAEYFPQPGPNEVLVEKSATYFDCEMAPMRVKALLPDAKIVIVLISPLLRAHSWYQHIKAHGNPTAVANDFLDVLRATEDGDADVWRFRQRCLMPGLYSHHIERWLSHFPSKQVHVVDGEVLKTDPAKVLAGVQDFLELQPLLNYSDLLVYNQKKGFYCYRMDGKNHTHCLGESKGRHYGPMLDEARRWLLTYYRPHNAALLQLLNRLGYEVPQWLQQELRETS